jgi:hypothetical protein
MGLFWPRPWDATDGLRAVTRIKIDWERIGRIFKGKEDD